MNIRKILALSISIIVLLTFVACGNDSGATSKTSSQSSASSEINSNSNDNSSANSDETSSKEAKKPLVKILPLGDSLTAGGDYKTGDNPNLIKSNSSYRSFLSEMLNEGGYNTKFVGVRNSGSSAIKNGDVMHSGYGGIETYTLSDKLSSMADCDPDIVLLMIGRNDMTEGTNPDNLVTFIDTYLVQKIYKMFPDVHIFLASVPAIRDREAESLNIKSDTDYAPKINEYVVEKKKSGANIDFVDMSASVIGLVWEDFTIEDFVHPQPSGYEKIAKRWYDCITDKITEIADSKAAE